MSTLEIILLVFGVVIAGGGATGGALFLQARRNPEKLAKMVEKSPKLKAAMTERAASDAAKNPDMFKEALRSHPDFQNHPQAAEIEARLDKLTPEQRAEAMRNPHSLTALLTSSANKPRKGPSDAQRKAKQKAARKARAKNRR